MSEYVKKKIEKLIKIGTNESLFEDSQKIYYKTPLWKFWGKKKVQYEVSPNGFIGRKFDRKGNLINVFYKKDNLDVRSKIIAANWDLPEACPCKHHITRTFSNGSYDDTYYLKNGGKVVLAGFVDNNGVYEANRTMNFDANGKQIASKWLGRKTVATGELKEMLQMGLSAQGLKDKEVELRNAETVFWLGKKNPQTASELQKMKDEATRARCRRNKDLYLNVLYKMRKDKDKNIQMRLIQNRVVKQQLQS